MDLVQRSEAKRSSALAVVVAFLAVLFGISQFASRPDAVSSARADGAVERLEADIARIRAEAAPIGRRTATGTPRLLAETARFVDDLDDTGLTLHTRARLIDHASGAVLPVCERCSEILAAARPTRLVDAREPERRGLWARKMIGLAP